MRMILLLAGKMTNLFDVILKGLDGLQGPVFVGTGAVHRRRVLYGRRPGSIQHKELHNRDEYEVSEYEVLKDKFRHSTALIASVIECRPGSFSASKDDILELICSSYETDTEWGKELGWIYGSCTEDVMTGLKQHSRGWRSIYCSPDRPPFVGTAPKKGSDIFRQRKRWHKGLLEILLSRNCPLFCGYGSMMFLQRVIYIHYSLLPLLSVPLILYGILPAFSLITAKPFIPNVLEAEIVPFVLLFISISVSSCAEGLWVRIGTAQWWSTVRMWMITTVTSSIAAVLEIFPALVGMKDSVFYVTEKPTDGDANAGAAEGFGFDSSAIFVPPTTFVLFNVAGLTVGLLRSIFSSRNLMAGEMLCVWWILGNMWPFVRGLFAKDSQGGLPVRTITTAACCASVLCCVAILSVT